MKLFAGVFIEDNSKVGHSREISIAKTRDNLPTADVVIYKTITKTTCSGSRV